jgi:PKD repeat protein
MIKKLIFFIFLILLVGTVNADTLIINSSRDGRLLYNPSDAATTWTALRNNAGTTSVTCDDPLAAASNYFAGYTTTTTTEGGFDLHGRGLNTFNTSDIPDTATITSAVLTVYTNSKAQNINTINASLIDASPTNPIDYGTGDYDATTFTRLATDIPYASIPAADNMMNFTLNAAGLSYINKTGYTVFMYTHNFDVDNLSFTWASNKQSSFYYRSNAYPTAGPKPHFLTVTYTTGSAPVSAFTCTKNFLRIPIRVTCTDSSTNTPTSWSWDMGDGSAAKTTQNVTYQFTKRGIWGITLNATNAQGSNITPTATNIKVVGYENYY